jgi:hypothetical protein
MNWKTWILNYAPKNWSIEDKLRFINLDCPNVTLEDVKRVIIARNEIHNSEIGKRFRLAEANQIAQDYEDMYE